METAVSLDSRTSSPRSEMRLILLGFFILILAGSFWLIDHTPFASDYYAAHSEIAQSENRTADRVQSVNLITASVRIGLGLLGVVFLMLPAYGKLHWGGITFFALLLYLGYLALTTIWSTHPYVSAQKYLVLICFSLAAIGLARQLSLPELATVFAFICLIYIFGGILVEIALGNFYPHRKEYRFIGTCHPNSMAVYGTFCCFVATAYFGYRPKINHLLVVLFAIGLITLLMTKSRTTLAGFGIAWLTTMFMSLKPNNRVFAFSVTMLLFVAIGMSLVLARSNIRSKAAESVAMGRTKDVSTLTGRLPLWEELVDSIEERPLIGYGYLAFWDKEKIEYLSDLLKWEIPHGHNMYLDVILDGGIVGLLLFLGAFSVAMLIASYRCAVGCDPHAALVFGFLFFAFVHGFAESLFKLPTFLSFMLLTLVLRMAFTLPTDRGAVEPITEPVHPAGPLPEAG